MADGTTIVARTRKPRGQGHARRGEILAAARRLFAEDGFEHATMRRIAATVGVSATALYVYFPDKEAILRAVAEDTFEQLLARLEASQDSTLPPLPRFRRGLLTYVRFGLAHPDEYRLVFTAPLPPAILPDMCGPAKTAAADLSFDVLERGIAHLQGAGLFTPGNAHCRAEAVWAALHGITALLLDRADALDNRAEDIIDTLLDLLIAGMQA